MSIIVLGSFLAASYLFWLDRSFQVAKSMETREEIEAKLYFVSVRQVQMTDSDFRWANEPGMIELLLPQPEAELYEYCFGGNCFHVSYDADGRKITVFDTYE